MPALHRLALLVLLSGSCCAQDPSGDPRPGQPQKRLLSQASAAEQAGNYGKAADAYLELVASEPLRADWVVEAGRCLGRAGRFNDAIELLTSRRGDFPDMLEVPAMLARTLLLKVETDPGILHPHLVYADAIRVAREVLKLHPGHADAQLILAQALYGSGDWEAAVATAEDAVRLHPDRAGAHILMGRIAFDRFKELKRQLADSDPDPQERSLQVAAIHEQRVRAQTAFRRAAELAPDRTFAAIALGELAAWDSKTEEALEHWNSALAIQPEAPVKHEWIEANTTWQERAAFYDNALKAHRSRPTSTAATAATLTWHLARAHYDGLQWQTALDLFTGAVEANPQHSNAWFYVMICAWRLGDETAAENAGARYAANSAVQFADILRNLPPESRGETAALIKYLGDRAFQQGRIDNSRDLNHVIACLQDSADAWNNYAFLCRETGKFKAALSGYEYALEREPDSPQLWNDAAVILQYHLAAPADLERAKGMYEHALELAAKVLADKDATELAHQRAKKAQSDARLNLQKLEEKD